MSNYHLLEERDPSKYRQLKDIWEPKKEYIEKDLWVIRNFLSKSNIKRLGKGIEILPSITNIYVKD